MSKESLRHLSLPEVISGCQAEAKRDRKDEVGYCFELFQRAFEDQDELAWEAIQEQYYQLVLSWIYNRVPASNADKAHELVQETLEKFWRTLTARSGLMTDHFDHVGALLNYLRQCTFTTVIDNQRRLQRLARLKEKLKTAEENDIVQSSPEKAVLDQILQEEQLARIRHWVETQVSDPQEKLVLHLSFELNMPPAEIARTYPEEFEDAQTVRRIKERVIKRAKRALL